jgi:hypothetical protein
MAVDDGEDTVDMAGEAITFVATVYKVQTLIDNGIRVTLDLPEQAIGEAAALMECKRDEVPLNIDITVAKGIVTERNHENDEGAKASPDRVGRRRLTKRRNQ